jgi:hypothetical protein
MWDNIGRIKENQSHMDLLPADWRSSDSSSSVAGAGRHMNDKLVLYADCHSTNTGLFSGLLFFVLTTIVVIVYYIMGDSEVCQDVETASVINNSYECFMHSVLILITIWVSTAQAEPLGAISFGAAKLSISET